MKNLAKKGNSAKSVFHEATYQTLIGQQYTKARINPSSQSNNRIQLRTLQPQLHPQRLRDHQVVTLDPKQSSNIPLTSREQPECNPTPMDPPERNPAEIEINSIDITPKSYSWMRLTKFLSYSGKTINDPAPVSLP